MSDKTNIAEGHYSDDNGNEYMSIWTYKRKNNIGGGNNYEDALALNASDKFKGPFNVSDRFKEGWMYNVNDLNTYYNK
jgi:hypothetical protein